MTEIPEIAQKMEDDLKVSLDAVTFSDGTRVELRPSSVLLVVGPNNSGKSRSLNDIWIHLSAENGVQVRDEVKAVPEVEVRKRGGEAALGAWLDDHASLLPATREKDNPQYATIGMGNVFWSGLRERWANGPPFGSLSSFLFTFAGGSDRLDLTDSVGAIDLLTEPPVQPLQILYADAKLERELVEATQEAFGVPITVNRVSGRNIHLHVGKVPKSLGAEVSTNTEYRAAIESLPLISDQGDGIRAYVGLNLLLVASEFSIVFVDEPEAFLHPPQERALGKRLAKQAGERGTQLVMATHSLDLLLGTLAQPGVDLTVVRLRRSGDVNRAAVLKPDRVKDLWADPIIRFSNVLDGIFHRGVVICEGDADATFYDATLTAALAATGGAEHNLLFLHCSGKARVPVIAEALRGLDVPTRVICDLDLLRDETELRRIVETLGGDWATISKEWTIVKAGADSISGTATTIGEVRRSIDGYLDGVEEKNLTRQIEREIDRLAKFDDAWSAFKRTGTAGLPGGDAAAAWPRLDVALRSLGLFVVPVGELERWEPGIPDHGPKWTVEALERRIHEKDGSHRAFLLDVASSID